MTSAARYQILWFITTALTVAPQPLVGDVVSAIDGLSYEGTVTRITAHSIVLATPAGEMILRRAFVKNVVFSRADHVYLTSGEVLMGKVLCEENLQLVVATPQGMVRVNSTDIGRLSRSDGPPLTVTELYETDEQFHYAGMPRAFSLSAISAHVGRTSIEYITSTGDYINTTGLDGELYGVEILLAKGSWEFGAAMEIFRAPVVVLDGGQTQQQLTVGFMRVFAFATVRIRMIGPVEPFVRFRYGFVWGTLSAPGLAPQGKAVLKRTPGISLGARFDVFDVLRVSAETGIQPAETSVPGGDVIKTSGAIIQVGVSFVLTERL